MAEDYIVKKHNNGHGHVGKVYVPKELIGLKVKVVPVEEFGALVNCPRCDLEICVDFDDYVD